MQKYVHMFIRIHVYVNICNHVCVYENKTQIQAYMHTYVTPWVLCMDVRIDIEQTDTLLSAYEHNSLTLPENDKLTACALELVSSIILSVSIFIIVLLLFVVFVYYCCLASLTLTELYCFAIT